jgi:hypothetical protein
MSSSNKNSTEKQKVELKFVCYQSISPLNASISSRYIKNIASNHSIKVLFHMQCYDFVRLSQFEK